MDTRLIRFGLAALTAALVIAVPAPASAAPPEPTPEAVKAFLDGQLPGLLERASVPGAAVSVVSGGKQVHAGGYGLADIAAGRAVDPEDTAMFIASVTKLFTATAVMQQVEQGRLDLDADVNGYLETFQIPDTYPGRPITLRNLLTHTAGFDGLVLGTGAEEPEDVTPLSEYIPANLPDRVRPPGELSSYDNFAVSLAGYIVEAATGVPFDAYVEEKIFAPLGMTMSTLSQPAPEPIRAALARGYTPADGAQVEVGGQYGNDSPAGAGTISTAVDMGRFMLAHLADGARVLAPETAGAMHSRQFGNHPDLPGLGLIFMERRLGAHRLIEHGGDSMGFHSGLWLLPEQDTGLFIAYNGDGDGTIDLGEELITAFVGHFFPSESPHPAPVPGSTEGLAGSYQIARMSRTDATRVLTLMAVSTVSARDDGTLDIDGTVYTRAGEDLYVAADGKLAGFHRDGDGRAALLFFSTDPAETYERLAWYQDPGLHLIVVAGLGLALLSALWWPVAAIRRRGSATPLGARLARITVAVFAAAVAGAVGIAFYAVSDFQRFLLDVLVGGTALLNGIPALLSVAALAGAATVAFTVLAWRRGWWTRAARFHYSAVVLALLAFLTVAGYYQLLGWPLTARL